MSFTLCVFVMHILNSKMYYITISIMVTILFIIWQTKTNLCNYWNLTGSKCIFRKSRKEHVFYISKHKLKCHMMAVCYYFKIKCVFIPLVRTAMPIERKIFFQKRFNYLIFFINILINFLTLTEPCFDDWLFP